MGDIMEMHSNSAAQILRIGAVMCLVWLAAATMLISQAQKTVFAAGEPRTFLAHAN
jgi:hypothetical protein